VGADSMREGRDYPRTEGPDPNSVAGEAGYGASSADNGQVAPGQRDRLEAVGRVNRSAGFGDVAQRAAPAVKTGLDDEPQSSA